MNHESSDSTEPPSADQQSNSLLQNTPNRSHPQLDLAAFPAASDNPAAPGNVNYVPASHQSVSNDPIASTSRGLSEPSPDLPARPPLMQHPVLPLGFRTISYQNMDLDDDDDDDDYEPAEADDDDDDDDVDDCDDEEDEDENGADEDPDDELRNDELYLNSLNHRSDPDPVLVNDIMNPVNQPTNVDVDGGPSRLKPTGNLFNSSLDADYEIREGIEYVAPHDIISLLRNEERCPEFDARGQQDAHEFLRFLLDKINDCMQELARPSMKESSPDSAHSATPELSGSHRTLASRLSSRNEENLRHTLATPDGSFGKRKGSPRSSLDATASPSSQERQRTTSDKDSTCSPPFGNLDNDSGKRRGPQTVRRQSSKGKRTIDDLGAASGAGDGVPAAKSDVLDSERRTVKRRRCEVDRGGHVTEEARHSFSVKDLISQLFGGRSVMATRCDECESVKERTEQFLDVSLPVEADRSLAWALSSHGEPEQLCGDNKYQCEQCQTHCEARRWWQLAALPQVLTVHLKLFAFDEPISGAGGKVPVAMSCPMRMKFGDWCSPKCVEKDDEYRLTSVIVHEGTAASSGHYYSYVYRRESGEWYCFDDSIVTTISEDELSKTLFTSMRSRRTAYLLFYSRVQKGKMR